MPTAYGTIGRTEFDPGPVRDLAAAASEVLGRLGDADAAQRVGIAMGRVERPRAVVCVAGEFKQGKSSLVNELVGRVVCPIDDDIATSAITLVHHSPTVQVTVRRRDGVIERIEPRELAEWVTEQGNSDNWREVERVEIGIPNRFLEFGPALVDTPGAGGLTTGPAAATLSFLPFADALLFVSDASAELSAPELDYLRRAYDVCPVVLVCQTKIDVHPEWRRIVDRNREHLRHAGLDLPVLAVSSALRGLALERGDRVLNDESGFPDLLRTLDERVLSRVKHLASARAGTEIAEATKALADALRSELAIIDDPNRAAETASQLAAARNRLDQLRNAGARWRTLLGDRMTDLASEANHRVRTQMRDLLRDADEGFERASSEDEWKALVVALQDRMTLLVSTILRFIDDEAAATSRAVAELLRDEEAIAIAPASGPASGAGAAWELSFSRASASDRATGVGAHLDKGFGVLRGAYGAVAVFGIMARLLPAAAASVLMSNPFTVGAGVAFGIKHVREQGARRLVAQRQEARRAFRARADEIQQEISKAVAEALRDVQREIRDGFTERIDTLVRTTTETAERCREAATQDATWCEQRRRVLVPAIRDLDLLVARSRSIGGIS